MPLDDDLDEDATEIAFHEAGHAVAAELCVMGWKEVRVFERDCSSLEGGVLGWAEYVDEHYDDTTPANLAFIAWAGCWAEARYISPEDPWSVLVSLQQEGGAGDMDTVYEYWNDPTHAPHETDEEWARSLDSVWPRVEALGEQLARERVIRSPLHPDG